MNDKIIKSKSYILNNNYKKIQLNINEFGYGHSKDFLKDIKKIINNNIISKYSSIDEQNEHKLKNNILKYLNIPNIDINNIILSNSGDINILSIYRLYKTHENSIILFTPTYGQYQNIGFIEMNNIINISIGLTKQINVENINNYIQDIKFDNNICFICNPNNPTGLVWDIDVLLYLFNKYSKCIFVIDETYIDFSKLYNNNIKSVIEYINKYDNIIIMRSFSKAFGLAGLRLSYLASNNNIINNLSKIISHKDVIEISKYAGCLIFKYIDHYKNTIKKMFEDKDKLIKLCNDYNIKYLNSDTNFICIYIGNNILQLVKIFNKHNILIKYFEDDKIMSKYIRLTIQQNTIDKIIFLIKKYIFLIDIDKFDIGLIDGCFDCSHYGHIMSIYNAKLHSKKLLCGTHLDEEIYTSKNKYPIFKYEDRIKMLESNIFIDVVISNLPYNTNLQVLNENGANIFYHGSDNIDKYPLNILNNNNKLVYYPRTKYISSSNLIERIKYYKECKYEKIKYGNILYLDLLYKKLNKLRNEIIDIKKLKNLIILNMNFDLFNPYHISILEQIKKKYPEYLIYIDLISNKNIYKIYSINEIRLILISNKLIDGIIFNNSNLSKIKNKSIDNIIQINTHILDNNNTISDDSFNHLINTYSLNDFI